MTNGVQTYRDEPRTLTHVMYALHTATWFSAGIFSVIAILINLVKSGDLPDDFYRSTAAGSRAPSGSRCCGSSSRCHCGFCSSCPAGSPGS